MKYSIITPTKNEALFIEETIKSVIAQDVLPCEWIIMDDESTDETPNIIQKYLADYPFIKYIKLTSFRKEYKNRSKKIITPPFMNMKKIIKRLSKRTYPAIECLQWLQSRGGVKRRADESALA